MLAGCGPESLPPGQNGQAARQDAGAVSSAGGPAVTAAGGQSPLGARQAVTEVLSPERYVPAAPARPTRGISLPIGKCLNYAGQLELDADYSWARPVVDADFKGMREAGFATLRLPINPARFAATTPPFTIDGAYLAEVGRVVGLATSAGLAVIIDNHANAALFASPETELGRFQAIWRQLAEYFQGEPSNVYFELLNEPHLPLDDSDLNSILPPIIEIIRRSNPTRPIIVGGMRWSDVDSLATLQLPDDPYIVPTFHYYTPMAFTHQGTSWTTDSATGLPYPMGRTFGSAEDYRQLDADIEKVRRYIAQTGRVPFLGEYGAIETIPVGERANYYAAVTRGFASVGVQSCVWGYANNFVIRDWAGWFTPILEAIATTAPTGEPSRPGNGRR